MSGLIVSDPTCSADDREHLARLLHDHDLPLLGFTQDPAPLFPPDLTLPDFLRVASAALLRPDAPLPMTALLRFIPGDPLPANVLRRHLFRRRAFRRRRAPKHAYRYDHENERIRIRYLSDWGRCDGAPEANQSTEDQRHRAR